MVIKIRAGNAQDLKVVDYTFHAVTDFKHW